jgi:hypothetical protein
VFHDKKPGCRDKAQWQIDLRSIVKTDSWRLLEEVPEELVAAVGRDAFEAGVASFDIGTEERGGPVGFLEVFQCYVDVVRQVALGRAQVLNFGGLAVEQLSKKRRHSGMCLAEARSYSYFGNGPAMIGPGITGSQTFLQWAQSTSSWRA